MRAQSVKIDTVPLPEKPVSIKIPVDLLQEFEKEPRIVLRHPWVIGVPVPELLISKIAKDPALRKRINKDFDIMLVPR
jgi:hypothetical protein